jgi:hypothetical protein
LTNLRDNLLSRLSNWTPLRNSHLHSPPSTLFHTEQLIIKIITVSGRFYLHFELYFSQDKMQYHLYNKMWSFPYNNHSLIGQSLINVVWSYKWQPERLPMFLKVTPTIFVRKNFNNKSLKNPVNTTCYLIRRQYRA